MTYILWPNQAEPGADLGGKARALAELQRDDLPIPAWFALTSAAFFDSLTTAQRQLVESGDIHGTARAMREEIRLDADPLSALEAALKQLCPKGEPVAVRSSANEEDGADHSFAGQFESFLYVSGTPETVAERVAAVWRSAYSPRVLAYRRQRGLPAMPRPPSVLIQRMVDADRAGVAFGADPVTGRRGTAVIAAVWGLGTSLVSGESDADTYHVDRSGAICLRGIAIKRTAHCSAPHSPEGIESIAVPEAESVRPVLTDEQVRAVANLARRAGRRSGCPQDIEWAIEAGRLYLLQSRPITALQGMSDPDGALNLWDNSNIAESYNGITTPLTFSFARRAYAEVYRQMCRTLGVPKRVIAANDAVFTHMLGLIRGHVYYNLLNWYRLLVLLPGYASNRAFMEQMMGVREGLPDEMAAEVAAPGRGARAWDRLRMAMTFVGIVANYVRLPGQIRRFHVELNSALAPPEPSLETMRADELAALYTGMELRLLTHWDPPLVNDLFAMIFHGLLGKLTARWCGDADGSIRNDLVRGRGGMISAEPAERVREMASALSTDPEMAELLRSGSAGAVKGAIIRRPAFAARYESYLDKFGDRCLEELKLESPTLRDDPTPLHRAIGRLACTGEKTCPQMTQMGADIIDRREKAAVESETEEDLRAKDWAANEMAANRFGTALTNPHPQYDSSPISGPFPHLPSSHIGRRAASSADRVPPVHRPLFNWVLRNARNRVRDRENLRFERTRLFGRVRQIFVEIGKRFAADSVILFPQDIFYLEVDEVLGFIKGTSTCTALRSLVAVRRAEFDGYRKLEPPADRFETRGAVYVGNTFRAHGRAAAPAAEDGNPAIMRGLPCCPGVVRARVRLILDPRDAEISPGSILAAERTDPGWVILFPAAAGLLVERGSLLSHSAIVAREMGIPAIVSIPGLIRRVADGDLVEMDGSTGVIRILKPDPVPEQKEETAGLLTDGMQEDAK